MSAGKVSQLRIPFTRDARLKLLSAIDPRVAGVSRRTWVNVAELLKQVELCTGSDGCFAYCETLHDRMFDRRGMPRSTFFRVRAAAGRLGLLQSRDRYARNGKTSSEWRVDWGRVVALAARSGTVLDDEAAAAEEPTSAPAAEIFSGPESETDRSQSGTDRSQSGTDRSRNGTYPFKGIVSSSVNALVSARRSTVDSDDQKCARAAELDDQAAAVRELAERVVARVGPVRDPRDWELAVKVAILSRKLGENWLQHSVNGVHVRRSDPTKEPLVRPWAALHTYCSQLTRDKLRLSFNKLLKQTEVPPALRVRLAEDRRARERLVAGREP